MNEALELIRRALVSRPDGGEEFFERSPGESLRAFVDRVVERADERQGRCYFGALQ